LRGLLIAAATGQPSLKLSSERRGGRIPLVHAFEVERGRYDALTGCRMFHIDWLVGGMVGRLPVDDIDAGTPYVSRDGDQGSTQTSNFLVKVLVP
jgi:hypothetical protein